jgi:hypothetical protein
MVRCLLFCTALVAGCATSSQTGVGLYYLTPQAIVRTQAPDLYEAVEQLRPRWLRRCVTVFRNNREYGGPETLREFDPDRIVALHFIPRGHPRPGAAATTSNDCPAIQVVMGGGL